MLAAGSETTTSTLRWGLLYMILHPEIQKRCREEILEAIGPDQLPSMKHKTLLPYTEAVIYETQRLGNVVPLSIPHLTMEPIQLHGYTIPEGTMVLPNIYAVNMNPKDWPDPHRFDPQRFLDENGKLAKSEKMNPFGIGKRACVGESLARMELFLFFTRLLQQYTFSQPRDTPLPSQTPITGLTRMPQPYDIVATRNQ